MSVATINNKTWTPEEILVERELRKRADLFAHTVENYGPNCIWWRDCSCYGCREHWDPEGIRDAWARNKFPQLTSFAQLSLEEREGAPEVTMRNVDHLLPAAIAQLSGEPWPAAAEPAPVAWTDVPSPGFSNETPSDDDTLLALIASTREKVAEIQARTHSDPERSRTLATIQELLTSL